ncbi:hypothetical protein IV417_15635 [Alphaproteobacteria bacterium KMM 3653]|uniref:Uncharacterized protein n=1 Tax=Harenicola maris TaxID=2841044 RepID=A0AAP2CUK5_9RHOB|nr:hypothetical protein [Harenicola maris]
MLRTIFSGFSKGSALGLALILCGPPAAADGPKFIRVAPAEPAPAQPQGISIWDLIFGTGPTLEAQETLQAQHHPLSHHRYMQYDTRQIARRSGRTVFVDRGRGSTLYSPWPYNGTVYRSSPRHTVNKSVSRSRVSSKISGRFD